MFKEIFVQLLQKNDITNYKLSKDTGIPDGLLSNYKTGKKTPSTENLSKIADYFSVTTDYLLGREPVQLVGTLTENQSETQSLTKNEQWLLDDFRSLSKQGQEYILQTMVMTKESYKKDDYLSSMENKIG